MSEQDKKMDELESLNQAQEDVQDLDELLSDIETSDEESQEEQESQSAEPQEEKDYKTLYENQKKRAEKAEAILKKFKAKVAPKKETQSESASVDKEEVVTLAKLYAKGYDDDEVEKLQKIAQVEGVSLSEAEQSDIFKLWREKRQEEKRYEQAQLRASRGGKTQVKKSFDSPDLTDEEHKALFKEKYGR